MGHHLADGRAVGIELSRRGIDVDAFGYGSYFQYEIHARDLLDIEFYR